MITPGASLDNSANSALRQLIVAEIKAAGGRITFARFMELALYAPELGYYTSKISLIGARGDYYTAPHLTPLFGQLIARQLIEFWHRLAEPVEFQLVEMGAGQGLLASDILSQLYQHEKSLWQALTYLIVERSETLREAQRRRLEHSGLTAKVKWCELSELEPASITGSFISNELVDAFPVHLVQMVGGQWQEIYVELDGMGQFTEKSAALSSPNLSAYFGLVGLAPFGYEEGYRTEINLAALDWLQAVARALNQGYVLTIDYGYQAVRRYHPLRRAGTLQTYNGHVAGDNPYLNLGYQDITAHVDFTALIKTGENNDLKTEGFTSQALFLAGLGISDTLLELTTPGSSRKPDELLAEYNAAQTLINPTKMGNFGVLIQSKNLSSSETQPPLRGLSLII